MSTGAQPLVPPHAAMMQILTGQWVSNCVSGLARLGIPDLVESGPKSVEELATATSTHPEGLYRLMRATASLGILAEGPDGKFSQTPLSATLRSDSTPSLRHFATFLTQEWHMLGWSRLETSVRTGETALDKVYGMPLFEYFSKHPELAANFNAAMTALSTVEAGAVADAYDFSAFRSLTDVAGGVGLLLATILSRNESMTGTLYDMDHVIESAKQGPLMPLLHRCRLAAGNMFEAIPSGSDAYIMKYIVHDWPDELCLKILKGCRAGVNAGGKLLVVDHVIPPSNDFSLGKILDLEMLLFPGGKERTEAQFRDLFAAAGWKLSRVIPTSALLSIVEGVPA